MSLRHVLLVYLDTGTASGYDIVKGFQNTFGYLWNASFQQVYRDLGKLHADGLVDRETVENGPRPPRKVYRLTPAGRAVMLDWLATPTKLPNVNDAFLVKLSAVHLLDPVAFRREFEDHRDGYRRMLAEFRELDAVFRSLPTTVLAKFAGVHLSLQWGVRQVEAWLEWAKDVEAFLDTRDWLTITADDAALFTGTLQAGLSEAGPSAPRDRRR